MAGPQAGAAVALQGYDVSFWLRMLFSCLVDADFLCTEGFMSPAQAAARGIYTTAKRT